MAMSLMLNLNVVFTCNSQLIHLAGASSQVSDFDNQNKILTAKLLKQGYSYNKQRKAFSKFYRRQSEFMSKCNVSCKTRLQNGLSEPEFYGNLVFKFRNIVGKTDF